MYTKEGVKLQKESIPSEEITTKLLFDREDGVTIGKSSVVGSRREQQDVIVSDLDFDYMEKGRMIAVLCDGMGGMQGGAMASQICAGNLYHAFHTMPENMNICTFFEAILPHLDNDVYSLKGSDGERLRSGTTLVCVVLTEGHLYLCNVGDSHAYLIREGKLNLISEEHNYMMLLLEDVAQGKLTLKEARQNPRREALVSYIGMGGLKYRQITNPPLEMRHGDTVVLCSDGLYRTLPEQEILQIVRQNGTDVQQAATQLTAAAIAKAKRNQDNTSVVVMKYQQVR